MVRFKEFQNDEKKNTEQKSQEQYGKSLQSAWRIQPVFSWQVLKAGLENLPPTFLSVNAIYQGADQDYISREKEEVREIKQQLIKPCFCNLNKKPNVLNALNISFHFFRGT